uniref:Extracellular membrane protein CFEM domain-containing protein n=1 Tax=Moniliophthora roreri TaxID=221103 RepID=A0A0W0F7Y3_MONRR
MIASITILSLLSTVVHASILSLTGPLDSTGSGNFSVLASGLPDLVPAACDRPCNGPVATRCANDVEDTTCACTNAFIDEYTSCLDCVVANDRSVTVQDGQNAMDALTESCNSLGFNVKSSKISPNGATRVGLNAVLGAGAAAGVSLLLL